MARRLRNVRSLCRTLQLHFPVWSAQAHTRLSWSQVWLSDPEKLHSHWVHCGKYGGRQTPSVCYQQQGRQRGTSRVCPGFMLQQTSELQNVTIVLLPVSTETSLRFFHLSLAKRGNEWMSKWMNEWMNELLWNFWVLRTGSSKGSLSCFYSLSAAFRCFSLKKRFLNICPTLGYQYQKGNLNGALWMPFIMPFIKSN